MVCLRGLLSLSLIIYKTGIRINSSYESINQPWSGKRRLHLTNDGFRERRTGWTRDLNPASLPGAEEAAHPGEAGKWDPPLPSSRFQGHLVSTAQPSPQLARAPVLLTAQDGASPAPRPESVISPAM